MNSPLRGALVARARVQLASDVESPRKKLNRLADRAMDVLSDLLETGEPSEQTDAARVLLAAWSRLMSVGGEDDRPLMTPEERGRRLDANFANPDPELRAALVRAGLLPAKEET